MMKRTKYIKYEKLLNINESFILFLLANVNNLSKKIIPASGLIIAHRYLSYAGYRAFEGG